jgi:hypothetical protein
MPIDAKYLRPGDYITPSRKFAIEHAITSSVYHEENYGVYMVLLKPHEIKEAHNPGEYIYIGEDKKVRLIGIAKYNEEIAD